MLGVRVLEATHLYAGLGVQLVDEFASVPSAGFDAPPFGWTTIELDVDDGGTWRALDPDTLIVTRTPGGIVWYPWLEHYRDARGRAPRNYRVRVTAELYTPRYSFTDDGVVIAVAPFDDDNPPATIPGAATKIQLLPTAAYPFAPGVPVLRGEITDNATPPAPVPNATVTWLDPANLLQTDTVLSDSDGEFALPLRRAPLNVLIDIHAERPGLSGDTVIRIPQDLSNYQSIPIS